jgi:nucleotide-binding universal stress UspA family protein
MKILIATDGTQHSREALEAIFTINLTDGDEIKVLSVVDMAIPLPVDLYGGFLPATNEIETAVRENAAKTVEEAALYLREKIANDKIFITTETLSGSPESRIVEAAEEMKADIIIVGSHGYNRWERLLLGSVSDSVIHHAPCSVLVVRTKEKNL